ncbi:MAG: hypothetical protein ACLVL7_12045 [Anaerotruncus massiliensis (ex Togo et al. 2019)]
MIITDQFVEARARRVLIVRRRLRDGGNEPGKLFMPIPARSRGSTAM